MPEITDQDLELFEKYKQLGSPDELGEVKQERDRVVRQFLINEAAERNGYDARVLEKLTNDLDLEVIDNEIHVVREGSPVKVTEFAEANWDTFMPVLKPENGEARKSIKVPYVAQAPATLGPSSSIKKPAADVQTVVHDVLSRRYAQRKSA